MSGVEQRQQCGYWWRKLSAAKEQPVGGETLEDGGIRLLSRPARTANRWPRP